jgi:hypothetical protein
MPAPDARVWLESDGALIIRAYTGPAVVALTHFGDAADPAGLRVPRTAADAAMRALRAAGLRVETIDGPPVRLPRR